MPRPELLEPKRTTAQIKPKPAVKAKAIVDGNPPEARGRISLLWLAGLGALLAIAIAVLTFVTARPSSEAAPPAAQTAAPRAAYKAAPALIEAASGERPLSFEVAGKLRAVFVEEGQRVKAGDLIAELQNADLVAKVNSTQAALNVTEARLGVLQGDLASDLKKAESEVARWKAELAALEPRREDVEQAEAETRAAEADAIRATEDAKRYSDKENAGKLWSVQLTEQTRRLAESAQAKFDAAQARLRALKNGARPADRERARAMLASAEADVARHGATDSFRMQTAKGEVEQARAQLEQAKAELAKTRIHAAIDGTIVRRYMHPGEVIDVLHPQPVVTLADMTQLRVRADVDEADIASISVGQRVKIVADAMQDGTSLAGTVEQISAATGQKRFSTGEAKEKMDVKIVETLVKFDAPPPANFQKLGLRVTTRFEIRKQ